LNARIEKQAAKAPTPGQAKNVVDQLVQRLDAVNERIESLEKRIADLES
jgi:polyhydroxyalkanoate synthesis regulator phasin